MEELYEDTVRKADYLEDQRILSRAKMGMSS